MTTESKKYASSEKHNATAIAYFYGKISIKIRLMLIVLMIV